MLERRGAGRGLRRRSRHARQGAIGVAAARGRLAGRPSAVLHHPGNRDGVRRARADARRPLPKL